MHQQGLNGLDSAGTVLDPPNSIQKSCIRLNLTSLQEVLLCFLRKMYRQKILRTSSPPHSIANFLLRVQGIIRTLKRSDLLSRRGLEATSYSQNLGVYLFSKYLPFHLLSGWYFFILETRFASASSLFTTFGALSCTCACCWSFTCWILLISLSHVYFKFFNSNRRIIFWSEKKNANWYSYLYLSIVHGCDFAIKIVFLFTLPLYQT